MRGKRKNPSGSPEWPDYTFGRDVTGHPGGERPIQKGWTSDPSDDRILEEARRRYTDLHGIEPENVYEQVLPPQPKMLVDLGPVTRVCYTKRIVSDLKEHRHLPREKRPIIHPEYCHTYGEGWPEGRHAELSDRASATERGDLYIVPRGNVVVTARGIEDKPVKPNRAVRVNPDHSRRNPIVEMTALTPVKVRAPSAFSVFVSTVLAGMIGAPLPIILRSMLLRGSPLSPMERAVFTASVSVLSGLILGLRNPRVGGGMAVAGLTVGGMDALESLEVSRLHSELPSAAESTSAPAANEPPRST
jgi:hypothetical protein